MSQGSAEGSVACECRWGGDRSRGCWCGCSTSSGPVAVPPAYAQIFQMAFQAQAQAQAQLLAQAQAPTPAPAPAVPTVDQNRLKYIVSLFVGNALIWWRSLKRAYEPREITWAEFQREFDDKYRPKMYRDKKRMEFLNLVQGDEQTVAEYELRFAALAKYAPEAVATGGSLLSF
ncbi:UNVERIFIED_CONTAM: hypothetical protein Scaly_2686300 [Sesamum calycinum]|uniref:Retrotransposon gag domain-containing protein n=1 Tax=Sesamum calycinum TaxID=2727403 RepID=A0AAW2J6X3_9LAMI